MAKAAISLPPPPNLSAISITWQRCVLHLVCAVAVLPLCVCLSVLRPRAFFSIVFKAFRPSIKSSAHYQQQDLIDRLLEVSCAAKAYLQQQNVLEYQLREGYCASATVRCMLKSIPNLDPKQIPCVKGGPSIPKVVKNVIDEATGDFAKTTIVFGDEGYEAFMRVIRLSNDARYRVAVNFLRSPLFQFAFPWFLPMNLLLGFFGGHFSPVVGYLESEDLVAIFDVNHTYGGVYFVDSKRLFDAINTIDLSVFSENITRALLVTEILINDSKMK